MKTLFYVLRSLLALVLMAGATSCAVSLFPKKTEPTAAPAPSPKEARRAVEFLEKYPDFVRQHRELFPRDTVKIKVPYTVPQIVVRTEYVPQHDTVYVAQDTHYLDTLLVELDHSLTVAQHEAAQAKVRALLLKRPVLRDTLRADTLGIHIKVWLSGRNYKILIRRDAIRGDAAGQVVTGGQSPCPALPAPADYPFYDPAGWPWWVVFLAGFLLSALLFRLVVEIIYRAQPPGHA
jgi:hypothetical protein